MWEAIWEAVIESLISLPILLVVYVLIEFIEHKNEIKFEKTVASSKKFGPLWGSALGCIPQCGFSALMADLFSKKMITIGTLFAVFVSTSDEAIALLASNTDKNFWPSIGLLLACKLVLAIIIGYILDLIFRKQVKKINTFKHQEHTHVHDHKHVHGKDVDNEQNNANNQNKKQSNCDAKNLTITQLNKNQQTDKVEQTNNAEHTEQSSAVQPSSDVEQTEIPAEQSNCDDCSHNHLHHKHELQAETKKSKIFWSIFKQGLWHTLEIFAWILVANVLLTVVLQLAGGEDVLMTIMGTHAWYQPFICTLIGLIPNCAGSVALVSLYMDGIISFASCLGGLCASAGIGFIILFKNNKNIKQNLLIMLGLYLIGVVVGLIFNIFMPFSI